MVDFKIEKTLFIDIVQNRDIQKDYDFIKELGAGTYGIVYEAIHKKSGEKRAVKAIIKDALEDKESFRNEIAILKQLDHPNIVKLYEIYEFGKTIYLVMELCEGGELFYFITSQKYLKESVAAKIMRQIFSAVAYLHSFKICHRDIKPENFLLKFTNDDSSIKLIDFGLSRQLRDNEVMDDPNGTPFYIAPEIIEGSYTEAIDNWSLGVMLYIMLSGTPPFAGKDNKEILKAVKKGAYTLSLKPFQTCSPEVKDLISKLLVKNVQKRYTAVQAYNHSWVQYQVESENKDLVIDSEVIQKIQDFLNSKALKKAIMLFVAQQIPERDVSNIRQLFVKFDKNGNGTISAEEFKAAFLEYKKAYPNKTTLDDDAIEKLYQTIDINSNGLIDYSEFLAIFMDNQLYKTEKYLRVVFEKFDTDKNGRINAEELRSLLGGGSVVPLSQVETIIKQADINGDGELDYEEILHYIKQARP